MTTPSESSFSPSSPCLGVIGAGTMGAGIAQVAALAGWKVELSDVDASTSRTAIEGIIKRLDRLLEKGRITQDECEATKARLLVATSPDCFRECDLIIEAIVEDLDIKTKVLSGIVPQLRDDAIIATNTSSLSVSSIGQALGDPYSRRVCGMHFFNPAPLMKLCEVIAGTETDPGVVDRVADIASSWGKQVARAADVPGFIVNHVARPYYLEAFRILEDGYATPDVIDRAMKEHGGFRMGPLELTDLIGQDINTATTRSVFEQLDRPPLLAPNDLQESLVRAGHLGRKTGRGVYDYSSKPPGRSLEITNRPYEPSDELAIEVNGFFEHLTDPSPPPVEQYIVARIIAALIVQGLHAAERGVATPDDIDTALKYGVNYPKGPFEWLKQITPGTVAGFLGALNKTVSDDRFAIPDSLRKML